MQRSREYIEALETFEKEMAPEGPFFFGAELGWVDILVAPCKHDMRRGGCSVITQLYV